MPKLSKWDKTHQRRLMLYQQQVAQLYDTAATEAAQLATTIHGELGDKPFSWKDYPLTAAQMEALTSRLENDLQATIANGIRAEWQLSNDKNDELANTMLGSRIVNLTDEQHASLFSTSPKALEAFLARKKNGLNLSERVWNYAQGFKSEIELGLDIGLRDGKASSRLARDLKQYLRYPDKLFRRVRNQHSQLVLSKRAAAFHPGRGVYRSSYMNSLRLAATETNIAYRTADHERWQQLDFVVGIRIVLSNNHNCKGFKRGTFFDICDELSAPMDYKEGDKRGLYPKDFKFTGWHPFCRCHAVPVLKTQEEFLRDLDRPEGQPAPQSENEVTDVPQEFKDWANKNKERIEEAKERGTQAYFLRDNKKYLAEVREQQQEPTNLSLLANALSIKVGKPMSFDEADHGLSNPHYNGRYGSPYSGNCQSCVMAYEARRRGLDVAAMPNYGEKGSASYELSLYKTRGWIDPHTGLRPHSTIAASPYENKTKRVTYEQRMSGVERTTKEQGRYFVSVFWEDSNSGHIFCVERLADGTLMSFDPQTGKKGILSKYLRMASSKDAVSVLRVDDKDFNLDIASKVLTEQSTPRFKGKSEAAASKGGMLGAISSNSNGNIKIYKKKLVDAISKEESVNSSLSTGIFYQSRKSVKRGMGHEFTQEEADAFIDVANHLSELRFVRNSPLGEVKNMTNPLDIANIKKKVARGVTSYHVYEWNYKGKTWIVKMEVYKNRKETTYAVYKKK